MTLQGDLFPAEPASAPPVPGLALVPDAIGREEERALEALVDAAPLAPFQFGPWQGKRLTFSYGSGYDFERGRVTEAPPIPPELQALAATLAPQAGVDPARIAHALLIRYDPGAGIGWHRDRPQYGEVLGLSLSTPCTLHLRRRTAGGFERHNLDLPPRSLYRLGGEVREEWEHSIAPMQATRRSVTFRTFR